VLRKVEEVGHGDRRVTMLGLAFKSQTDDLRESPSVDLAEYLIGKGLELNIHDPVVNPALLTGTNLRQVTERLPHLHRALFDTAEEALADSSVVVISSGARELRKAVLAAAPAAVFDLHGRLGADIEALPGYEGVGW
jgi:GDP-mannose 6-dehydrogenase